MESREPRVFWPVAQVSQGHWCIAIALLSLAAACGDLHSEGDRLLSLTKNHQTFEVPKMEESSPI